MIKDYPPKTKEEIVKEKEELMTSIKKQKDGQLAMLNTLIEMGASEEKIAMAKKAMGIEDDSKEGIDADKSNWASAPFQKFEDEDKEKRTTEDRKVENVEIEKLKNKINEITFELNNDEEYNKAVEENDQDKIKELEIYRKEMEKEREDLLKQINNISLADKKENETKDEENKKTTKEKSNRQQLRDAENKIREIKIDQTVIEREKQELMDQGYPEDFATKLATLNAEIVADEKIRQIYIDNPKIQNGEIKLEKLEKKLEKNIEDRDDLLLSGQKTKESPKDKEDKIEETKRSIFGFFRSGKKNQIEKEEGEEEDGSDIETERAFSNLENLEKLNKEKRESGRGIGAMAARGLDNWETFGKGEKGASGFSKRMLKNGINLALIGLISSYSVEKMAEAGVGTATSLAGGTFSYLGNKMIMGMGFVAAFDLAGNKISINNESRFAKGAQKAMPWIIGIGSVAAAYSLSGGTVAVASGLGFLARKFWGNKFTKEKIEERREEKREGLLARIKAEGETISLKKMANYEKEYSKIIKKYDRMRIWGRLVDGAMKLAIGSAVSAATLEAVGYAKDHMSSENTSDNENKDEGNSTTTKEDGNGETQKQEDSGNTENNELNQNEASADNTSSPDNTNSEQETNPETQEAQTEVHNEVTATADNGQGAISTIRELQHNLKAEYSDSLENNPDGVPESVKHILNTDADDLAKEYGMYKPGEDAESVLIKSGESFTVDENGNVSFGNTLLEKGNETQASSIYDGKMFDSDNSGQVMNPSDSNDSNILDSKQGDPDYIDSHTDTSKAPEDSIPPEQEHTTSAESREQYVSITGNKEVPLGENLSQIEIGHVHKIFNDNIDHLFHERPTGEWESIQKNINAERILELSEKGEISRNFEPLVNHIKNLQEVTGLRPYGADIFHQRPETIPHFIGRALEEAQRLGKLEKVTL